MGVLGKMPELNSAGPSITREELEMPAQRQRSWLTDAEVIVQQEEVHQRGVQRISTLPSVGPDMETPPAVRHWLQQQRRSGAAAATADDPDLVVQHSLPQDDPQQRAEIAPLAATLTAPGADTAAARARVERDVAEADELLRQWEVSPRDQAPFDLTVQPAIGGEEAAVTLKGVTSSMKVGQLHWRIQQEMESKPHPDQQQLFILGGDKGALEDGELPIGAYGVVSGVKLHLAIRDEGEAAARRLARGQLRDDQRVVREARDAARARRKRVVKRTAKVMCFVATTTLLVLLSAYFNGGCGACENGAACEGLFGACACAGNHLGEYCEHSCGEYGQVNGSACVCSGNHTGKFCEITDMIMRSEYNNATVQAPSPASLVAEDEDKDEKGRCAWCDFVVDIVVPLLVVCCCGFCYVALFLFGHFYKGSWSNLCKNL